MISCTAAISSASKGHTAHRGYQSPKILLRFVNPIITHLFVSFVLFVFAYEGLSNKVKADLVPP